MGGELAVGPLILGVPEPLQHHLSCGRGRDAAETLRGVLPFAEHVAVFVELASQHPDRTRFAVDVDVRVGLMALGVPVCAQHRGLDVLEQVVERDASLNHYRVQSGHVDVHVLPSVSALRSVVARSISR